MMVRAVPKVSVVIPTYNCGAYILQAVASVFQQSFTDYELIVVDDGSSDRTGEILAPYRDRLHFISQANQGVGSARNRGLAAAKGEFVVFLDADDYFLPNKLTHQVAVFQQQPHLGIVHSGWRQVNQDGDFLADVCRWQQIPQLDLESWLRWKPVGTMGTMMFRRDWLRRVGGFTPGLTHAEDVDLVLRLLSAGCAIAWLPEITICYRLHSASAMGQGIKQARCLAWVINCFFSQTNLPDSIRSMESEVRFTTWVWIAWYLYHTDFWQEAITYLQESWHISPERHKATVARWVENFIELSTGSRHRYRSTLQLPEKLQRFWSSSHWQNLLQWVIQKDTISRKDHPLVSIVIPTYNSENYLCECIESIFYQTYANYEIIVINDGSKDNPKQAIFPYLGLLRYIDQQNQGVSATRNRGISLAKGELVVFLDADDCFLPDKLENQVAVFQENPQAGIVQSGWWRVNQQGELLKCIEPWHYIYQLNLEAWLRWKPMGTMGTLMFRRDWLQRVGGFDTRLRHAEDVDLVLRLSLQGCGSAWLRQHTVCYRQHDRNTMRDGISQAASINFVLDKFFAMPQLPEYVRLLENWVRYTTLVWSAWYLYRTGFLEEMVQYLQRSRQYCPYLPAAMVVNWLESMQSFSREVGEFFDPDAVSRLPQWQGLVKQVTAVG